MAVYYVSSREGGTNSHTFFPGGWMRTLIMTMLLWSIACSATAGKNQFLTAGVSRTRALAMGSAYHSVVDDLSVGFYNPGAFKLNRTRSERKYRLFFNPLGGGTAMYDYAKYDRDYIQDNKTFFVKNRLINFLIS